MTISARSEYSPSYPFSDLELLLHPEAQSQKTILINYLSLSYGLDDNLTVGVNVPYSDARGIRGLEIDDDPLIPPFISGVNSSGMSDTSFFSLWNIYNEDDKHAISMAVLAGLNTPTGVTSRKNHEGELLATENQPGTGAWVPFGGLIVTKNWSNSSLSGNLIYTQSTEGSQKSTLGSIFDYNFAYVYELYINEKNHIQFDTILEFNGEYVSKNRRLGISDPSSGGNSIFILPGWRLNIHKDISLYAGVGIPVLQDYYGIQVKTKYNAIAGVDFNF